MKGTALSRIDHGEVVKDKNIVRVFEAFPVVARTGLQEGRATRLPLPAGTDALEARREVFVSIRFNVSGL